MATARARKDAARFLSANERRWLLDQVLRREPRTPVPADAATGAEEASSVIVRPATAAPDPPVAPTKGTAPEPGALAPPVLPAMPALPIAPEPGPMIPQYSTRDAHRAASEVDIRRYRAVFACCCEQARDAPTEQSPSG